MPSVFPDSFAASASGSAPAFQTVPLLAVRRGAEVESLHRGSVAVVAEDGRLLAAAGDPLQEVFLRSAAKPFQLTPLLASGGERAFGLTTEEIALAAASHGGEELHVAAAREILRRGGFTERDLRCGAHRPMGEEAASALATRGEEPAAVHNNCSGKHAAMLLACRLLGFPARTYDRPDHPLQRRIRAHLARFAGLPEEAIGIAVDGCAVPVFRAPLYNLALSYARLLGARLRGETLAEERARRRIAAAMAAAPLHVAGTGRFTTALLAEYGGPLIGKEGAEAVYAVAVAPRLARRAARALGLSPRGADGALGIAFKIEDGNERGRNLVCVELLRRLGLASGRRLERLRRAAPPAVRNARGDVVGEMRPLFSLGVFAPGRR